MLRSFFCGLILKRRSTLWWPFFDIKSNRSVPLGISGLASAFKRKLVRPHASLYLSSSVCRTGT